MSVVTLMYRADWLEGLEGRLRTQLLEQYGNHSDNDKYLTFSEAMDFAQYKVGISSSFIKYNSYWDETQIQFENKLRYE